MADIDIIEGDGSVAQPGETIFGQALEQPTDEDGFRDSDDMALELGDPYEQVLPFGYTWEFNYITGRFVTQGRSNQVAVVSERDAFAQWCMNVLSTERYTAFVYSDRIGVEFEALVQDSSSDEIAGGMLEAAIDDALSIHDRYAEITEFSSTVEGDLLNLDFTVDTDDGEIEISRSVQI